MDVFDRIGGTWYVLSPISVSSSFPYGDYDEPEVLSYAVPLIYSIGADVKQ